VNLASIPSLIQIFRILHEIRCPGKDSILRSFNAQAVPGFAFTVKALQENANPNLPNLTIGESRCLVLEELRLNFGF
jgi:hypothetical protein